MSGTASETVAALTELEVLKLENLMLRRRVLQSEAEKLDLIERALHAGICARLGTDGACTVDLVRGEARFEGRRPQS